MADKIEDGGPAFSGGLFEPQHGGSNDREPMNPGMSLRDWFAGQALAGLMAHPFEDGGDFLHDAGPDAAAYQSYRMADAMLAARKAGA